LATRTTSRASEGATATCFLEAKGTSFFCEQLCPKLITHLVALHLAIRSERCARPPAPSDVQCHARQITWRLTLRLPPSFLASRPGAARVCPSECSAKRAAGRAQRWLPFDHNAKCTVA
jgi:hypothetical protein